MPATRNILNHLRFEVAAGRRTCDVSQAHIIRQGERHLAYEKVPGNRINICMACAPNILSVAQNHLTAIISELNL